MRFVLIDQILEQSPQKVRAVKGVSSAEEYLADHFPGFAVLPGVLMLEAMAQAGRALAGSLPRPPSGPLVVEEVRNLRYGQMVRPGQALEVEVSLRRSESGRYEFQGSGSVEGQLAVRGRFTLGPIPAAAATDEEAAAAPPANGE